MSDEDHDEAHEEEGEPWLVSYADLMTLLFGFFVLMYTFAAAKNDPESSNDGMIQIRKEVAKYFGGTYVTPLDEAIKNFKAKIKDIVDEDFIEIKQHPEGLDITFKSTILFHSGHAELLPIASNLLSILIDEIRTHAEIDKIIVEGHTDNVPIKHSKIYPSNWELSGARASTVIRMFEANGFAKKKLTAIGFGDSRPLHANADKNGIAIIGNQALNRRVLLKVLVDTSSYVK